MQAQTEVSVPHLSRRISKEVQPEGYFLNTTPSLHYEAIFCIREMLFSGGFFTVISFAQKLKPYHG